VNRGLWIKAARETALGTMLFGIAVFGFQLILWAVLPSFQEQMQSQLLSMPLIRNFLKVLIGADVGEQLGPMIVGSIAWVHPVVLAVVWAHEIVFCTRMPVGEIDRGTVDAVLGLPVSRWQAYVTETIAWVCSGVVLLSFGFAGNLLGSSMAGPEFAPAVRRLLIVLINLFCLYLAVGGVTYMISACSDRRGRAVGTIFGLVVSSFFVHALAQLWSPAESFAFLGFLHYYRPFAILQEGAWPLLDMLVLLLVGGAAWGLGGSIFARRDICTV